MRCRAKGSPGPQCPKSDIRAHGTVPLQIFEVPSPLNPGIPCHRYTRRGIPVVMSQAHVQFKLGPDDFQRLKRWADEKQRSPSQQAKWIVQNILGQRRENR